MTGATIACVSREGRSIELDLDAGLTPADRESIRSDANAWIKRLRLADYGGQSMRDRFTYRGDSLWWFTELYLHKMRRFEAALATLTALGAAIDQHSPTRLVLSAASPVVREAARAFGAARKIPVDLGGVSAELGSASTWSSYVIGLTSRLPRWRPSRGPAPSAHPAIAAFVHTAFWRSGGETASGGQETYIGPVLDAVARLVPPGDLHFVGVGPRRNFRARRWWWLRQSRAWPDQNRASGWGRYRWPLSTARTGTCRCAAWRDSAVTDRRRRLRRGTPGCPVPGPRAGRDFAPAPRNRPA